jgi:hypothetical protein
MTETKLQRVGVALAGVGLVLFVVSFGVPHWYKGAISSIQLNQWVGLWQVCAENPEVYKCVNIIQEVKEEGVEEPGK